jgi:hypothetical protein
MLPTWVNILAGLGILVGGIIINALLVYCIVEKRTSKYRKALEEIQRQKRIREAELLIIAENKNLIISELRRKVEIFVARIAGLEASQNRKLGGGT